MQRRVILIPHDSMPGAICVGVRAPLSLGSTVGNLTHSGGGAVVVVQHAAQSLAPLDHACFFKMAHPGKRHSPDRARIISGLPNK
jgi:hypothetical protein